MLDILFGSKEHPIADTGGLISLCPIILIGKMLFELVFGVDLK